MAKLEHLVMVRLPEEMMRALTDFAEREDRTKSAAVRHILSQRLVGVRAEQAEADQTKQQEPATA